MLPGKTQSELADYAAKQPVAILQNTKEIQAVEVKKLWLFRHQFLARTRRRNGGDQNE